MSLAMTMTESGKNAFKSVSNLISVARENSAMKSVQNAVTGKLLNAYYYLGGHSNRRAPADLKVFYASDELRQAAKLLSGSTSRYEDFCMSLIELADEICLADGSNLSDYWQRIVYVETRRNHIVLSPATENVIHAITPWGHGKYQWINASK